MTVATAGSAPFADDWASMAARDAARPGSRPRAPGRTLPPAWAPRGPCSSAPASPACPRARSAGAAGPDARREPRPGRRPGPGLVRRGARGRQRRRGDAPGRRPAPLGMRIPHRQRPRPDGRSGGARAHPGGAGAPHHLAHRPDGPGAGRRRRGAVRGHPERPPLDRPHDRHRRARRRPGGPQRRAVAGVRHHRVPAAARPERSCVRSNPQQPARGQVPAVVPLSLHHGERPRGQAAPTAPFSADGRLTRARRREPPAGSPPASEWHRHRSRRGDRRS